MLDNEGKQNIKSIKNAAQIVWGEQCKIEDIQVHNAPFCMFELKIKLYDSFDILLIYDRSLLSINLKVEDNYINIRKLTNKQIRGGFDSCKLENLLYNFRILDEILTTNKQK